jgi:hypothetical protein
MLNCFLAERLIGSIFATTLPSCGYHFGAAAMRRLVYSSFGF